MRRRLLLLPLLLALLPAAPARADVASTSYLTISASGQDIDVQWSLAVRDLEDAVGIDTDGTGVITWAKLRAARDRIAAYAQPRLRFASAGAACPSGPARLLVDRFAGSAYAVLRYTAHCPVAITALDISYAALFEIDPRHRGLLNLTLDGAARAGVFSPAQPRVHVGATADAPSVARQFFAAGVSHLLGGADHLLFIAMLLVPALLGAAPAKGRLAKGRLAKGSLAEGGLGRLLGIVRVLTAFTVAHAITLTLAVLRLVALPPGVAEPAIALTILITAVDNVIPFLRIRREVLALGFGLVHGLSVAGGLGPLALPPGLLALALLSFNLGLEATQILIAIGCAPIAYCLRATPLASRRVLPILSGAAAVIACVWLSARIEPPLLSAVAHAGTAPMAADAVAIPASSKGSRR